nr:hypothetical protein CFP56_78528 [Quercus suber]
MFQPEARDVMLGGEFRREDFSGALEHTWEDYGHECEGIAEVDSAAFDFVSYMPFPWTARPSSTTAADTRHEHS